MGSVIVLTGYRIGELVPICLPDIHTGPVEQLLAPAPWILLKLDFLFINYIV